jgi:hypothetical protein
LENPCGPIPPRQPKIVVPSDLVHHKDGPCLFPSLPSLPGGPHASAGPPVRDRCLSWAHLSGSPPPNSLPCRVLAGVAAMIPAVAPNRHLHHHATTLPTCAPASFSYHVAPSAAVGSLHAAVPPLHARGAVPPLWPSNVDEHGYGYTIIMVTIFIYL